MSSGSRHVLWAPWRMEYIRGPREGGCIFCEALGADDPAKALLLGRTRHAAVMMNRYPYGSGHLLVFPRKHEGEPTRLSPAVRAGVEDALHRSMKIVDRVFGPDGCNVGMNVGAAAGAGVRDHLHWHVVPRWIGDTNFMPVASDVRVVSQHLDDAYAELVPHFARWSRR